MALREGQHLRLTVVAGKGRVRLDRYLSDEITDISRNRLQSLIKNGTVKINGQFQSEAKFKVKDGDRIEVVIPPPEPSELLAQAIPLKVVYEDEDIIVVNKPAGLVVHPAPGNPDRTLVNALLAHCGDSLKGVGGVARPGIVHRLDKGTSGLLVAAKTEFAHAALTEQFSRHSIERAYQALVWGVPSPTSGTIEQNIGRNPANRKKMAVVKHGGKHAITHYAVLQTFETLAARVACRLETGRTHQIRVHLSSRGHPVIGDPQYGGGDRSRRGINTDIREHLKTVSHQALHAAELGILHPSTGKALKWRVDAPAHMEDLVHVLERNN